MEIPAAGTLGFTPGGGEPFLAMLGGPGVRIRKPTSGLFLFPGGGSISIGTKAHKLTAQSAMEARGAGGKPIWGERGCPSLQITMTLILKSSADQIRHW